MAKKKPGLSVKKAPNGKPDAPEADAVDGVTPEADAPEADAATERFVTEAQKSKTALIDAEHQGAQARDGSRAAARAAAERAQAEAAAESAERALKRRW